MQRKNNLAGDFDALGDVPVHLICMQASFLQCVLFIQERTYDLLPQ